MKENVTQSFAIINLLIEKFWGRMSGCPANGTHVGKYLTNFMNFFVLLNLTMHEPRKFAIACTAKEFVCGEEQRFFPKWRETIFSNKTQ